MAVKKGVQRHRRDFGNTPHTVDEKRSLLIDWPSVLVALIMPNNVDDAGVDWVTLRNDQRQSHQSDYV